MCEWHTHVCCHSPQIRRGVAPEFQNFRGGGWALCQWKTRRRRRRRHATPSWFARFPFLHFFLLFPYSSFRAFLFILSLIVGTFVFSFLLTVSPFSCFLPFCVYWSARPPTPTNPPRALHTHTPTHTLSLSLSHTHTHTHTHRALNNSWHTHTPTASGKNLPFHTQRS